MNSNILDAFNPNNSELEKLIEAIVEKKVQEKIELILPELEKKILSEQQNANLTLKSAIDVLEEFDIRMNDNSIKRIFVHPISILILSLISAIFAVVLFEYITATNETRQNATWFYVNSNLVIVPFLTVILSLVINLIIGSIKESIQKEEQLLYTKLKQAIDESAEKQRIALEKLEEKQRIADEKQSIAREKSVDKQTAALEKERDAREKGLDKQTAALEKERDAREKGQERLGAILNRMELKYGLITQDNTNLG